MKGIHIQTLAADEVSRAGEIDRSERMHVGYRVEDGRLVRDDGDWNSVPWSLEGDSHSVTAIVRGLEEVRGDGGTVWGAFDGSGRLVGIASLRPRLTQTQAQMDLLHVSNGHRRCGIGSMLCQQAEDAARASGAREMYVSATPHRLRRRVLSKPGVQADRHARSQALGPGTGRRPHDPHAAA